MKSYGSRAGDLSNTKDRSDASAGLLGCGKLGTSFPSAGRCALCRRYVGSATAPELEHWGDV